MAKRPLTKSFVTNVQERFSFLVEAGFEEPALVVERDFASLSYESDRFTVEVSLVPRDGVEVSVVPGRPTFPPRLSSGLDCLYQAAGLGPVNWIKHTVTSEHSLEKAIDSNAKALEDVLPILTGPRLAELVEQCSGRSQTPRGHEPARSPGFAGA